LGAEDGRIRAAAVRVLSFWHPHLDNALDLLGNRVGDDHPRVRLEAVRALGKMGSARAAELALSALDYPMDSFLDYALWLTINDLAEEWVAAVLDGEWEIEGRERQLEFGLQAIEPGLASEILSKLLQTKPIPLDGQGPWIEMIGKAGGPRDLRRLHNHLLAGEFTETAADQALAALSSAMRVRKVKPAGDLGGIFKLVESEREAVRAGAIRLIGHWQLNDLAPELLQFARASSSSGSVRQAAFESLREIGGGTVIAGLRRICGQEHPLPVRQQAAQALAALDLAKSVPLILEVLRDTREEAQALTFWRGLLSTRGAAPVFARALADGRLPASVAQAGLRAAREGGRSEPDLVLALARSGSLDGAEEELTPAEMQQLAGRVIKEGDPFRGELVYRRAELACVSCHAIGGAGGKVGPDLTSIGASAPVDYLIESMLYPNAKVKEGYHSIAIETTDGQEFSGILVRETTDEMIVRNALDVEVAVPKRNIERHSISGSLMPSGLMDALEMAEQIDLYRFMAELGKPGPFDASKNQVARSWNLYAATLDAVQFGDEWILENMESGQGWSPVFTLVDGRLLREELEKKLATVSHRAPPAVFASTRLQVPRSGPVRMKVSGLPMQGFWINGQALPPSEELKAELEAGTHLIVVKLDSNRLPEALRLETEDGTFLVD
jgi:putative heme-binding domain-containing protein